MTETPAETSPSKPDPQPDKGKKAKKPSWTFTDDGCRWDVRLSLLIMLMAVFLWLWLTPPTSAPLYLIAAPFFMIGVALQAWQSRTHRRPGYPLKLGIILTILGAFMVPDALYRETVGGPIGIQPMALLILFPGLWILACWPLTLIKVKQEHSV